MDVESNSPAIEDSDMNTSEHDKEDADRIDDDDSNFRIHDSNEAALWQHLREFVPTVLIDQSNEWTIGPLVAKDKADTLIEQICRYKHTIVYVLHNLISRCIFLE